TRMGALAAFPHWINSAAGVLPDGTIYIFGGDQNGNPNDGLYLVKTDGTVKNWSNIYNNQSFPGAEKLRYVSNSHFVRNGKIQVYGGWHELRNNSARVPGYTLYEVDASAPKMTVV